MSSYPAKRLVNKYWKRPKPKIYDCNIRDAERIYKDSYNQYLQTKHFYASHGTTPSDIEEQFATRWTLDRMRNALDTINEPLSRRDGSALSAMDYGITNGESGYITPSYTRHDSLTENNIERPTGRARSLVQSLRDSSPDGQLENIESRLERIKRLRQELELDSHEDDKARKLSRRPPRGMSPSDSRVTNESQNSYSYKSSNRSGREPSSDLYESKFSQRSERTSRMNDLDNDASHRSYRTRQEEEDKYSYRSNIANKHEDEDKFTPRSSRLANKYGDEEKSITKRSKLGVTFENDDKYSQNSYKSSSKYDDEDKYSKGSRFNKYDKDDGASYAKERTRKTYDSEESSFSSKPRNDYSDSKSRRARKVNIEDTEDITNPDEEDAIVSNIRKKFPTSDEILQKISKYDVEL